MKRIAAVMVFVSLVGCAAGGFAAEKTPAAPKPPVYIWFEPEWFEGVEGGFAYWTGPASFKPTGHWGVAGPGISAEWTQGGESEWNSMGVPPQETKAECHREFTVPRAGKYKVWVRYYDHRDQTEPFTVTVEQGGRKVLTGELGVKPVVPPNDEYQLYWGFSFGWAAVEGTLKSGPARLTLAVNKPGETWRQVDAVLVTDDPAYEPVGREKPPFAYTQAFTAAPATGAGWRGSAKGLTVGSTWSRYRFADQDFTMWVNVGSDKQWWTNRNVDATSLSDVLYEFGPPADIREAFHKQFAGAQNLPVLGWSHYVPGFYFGEVPDLSPDQPMYRWLARTKQPFFLMTNYANPAYNATNGPATYQALSGPLAGQFLGSIHGESLGTLTVQLPTEKVGKTRREYSDAAGRHLLQQQAAEWSKFFKTTVPESFRATSIACLGANAIAFPHLLAEIGARTVAYELDATNVHVPMRIAFMRGAARQYGRAWINYASGNFGDACNYFMQNPAIPRGAQSWFHSKYAVTDGVSTTWYRKMYYLNYLGGASAIYWEQGLGNQWILPGPGTHPIGLSPFGRATEDFQAFVDRLPDRGEPYTPIAVLLSYGHGYDRLNNECKMLYWFTEDRNDLELRELFNVLWYPSGVVEGQPHMPDVQSLPNGVYGNIFDVLVDRPARAKAIFDYPVVWAAGDADLGGLRATVEEYVRKGGTLVLNVADSAGLPAELLGVKPTGRKTVAEQWTPAGGESQACTPFEVANVTLTGAEVLAWAAPDVPLITRHKFGEGAVILVLVPNLIGQDERAHPALPWLVNGLTQDLMPVEVRAADGQRLQGQIMYQVNRTKDGYLVALVNGSGVDKTQNGVARVDRRQFVDVLVQTRLPVKSAREFTQPRDLPVEQKDNAQIIRIRVQPGDLQVVGLTTK